MPVRIYFQGLILFRFPHDGDDAGKLVAELISEPPGRQLPPGAMASQDDHQAEIQIATGDDVRRFLSPPGAPAGSNLLLPRHTPDEVHRLLPRTLHHGARIDIAVERCVGGVEAANSFKDHVPDIARLAAMTNPPLSPGRPDQTYVRNTVVVDCGRIRANEVVTWDTGFPLGQTVLDTPSAPAAIKFMGVDFGGHAARECVVEFPESANVSIRSAAHPELSRGFRAVGGRNQLAPEDTLEITIRNFEYQRDSAVPWGMDFQWLFARLGYGVVDLGGEFDTFANAPRDARTAALLQQDRASMIQRARDGRPFPYIVDHGSLTTLTKLQPVIRPQAGKPATGTKSRPLCVQGTT